MIKFEPLRYIKKYTPVIISVFVVLTLALFFVLNKLQSYTASAVIDYIYSSATEGYTPDGQELQTADIYSSYVISKALDNLGLSQVDFPIDTVRSSIEVTQVEDPAITAINDAIHETGKTSDLQSTKYQVSYTIKKSDGGTKDVAREILDEVLDVYFTYFSSSYINPSSIANTVEDVNSGTYDYLEQIEIIDNAVTNALTDLSTKAETHSDFYASSTGYSFNDLYNQFKFISTTRLNGLYAYVLGHRVTEDSSILISKYQQRLNSCKIEQTQMDSRFKELEGIINTYVAKLRESNNTAKQNKIVNQDGSTSSSNVLGNVYDPFPYAETVDGETQVPEYNQTTEYDSLLNDWVALSDDYNTSVQNSTYYQYVIDCFNGNTNAVKNYQKSMTYSIGDSGYNRGKKTANAFAKTGSSGFKLEDTIYETGTDKCTQADIDYVKSAIDEILTKLTELYVIIAKTDSEYNDFLGANNIKVTTSNHSTEKFNITLYMLAGGFVFIILGCLGVIVLGRIGDMFEYAAYTDHKMRIPNRTACDRFIQRYQNKVLPSRFGCLVFQLLNQAEINKTYGREAGDEAMDFFAKALKDIFEDDQSFIGYNGSGQFMVFSTDNSKEDLDHYVQDFKIQLNEHFKEKGVICKYTTGYAESSDQNTYRIRNLIGRAFANKNDVEAGGVRPAKTTATVNKEQSGVKIQDENQNKIQATVINFEAAQNEA